MDKSTINYAAVMGFKEDLHLEGDQYGLLGSIFYLGYLLFQVGLGGTSRSSRMVLKFKVIAIA